MRCLKFTCERGNDWSGNPLLHTETDLKADFHCNYSTRARVNLRLLIDIPLVEIDVNVNSRKFQPMECLSLIVNRDCGSHYQQKIRICANIFAQDCSPTEFN